MNNLILSFKDFFTFRFLMFSLLPLIFSSAIFLTLFAFLINYVSQVELDENMFNFFLGTMILHALQVLIMFFTVAGGGFLALNLSVFFALFIVSFLTPYIVKEINLKYYNYNKLDEISFLQASFILLKIILKFAILLFFNLILYIIPVVNFFAPILLFFLMFYLFYNFLIQDVASCVLNKNDFLNFNPYKITYLAWVFGFYLICNIPWIGFFLPVFFVIFLSHCFFQKELQLKNPLA